MTTDAIRDVLRSVIPTDVLPELHAELLRRRETSEPLRRGDRHLARLDRIRLIQEHLMDHAHRTGTAVIDSGEAGDLTQDIVDEIVRRLDEVA